MPYLLPVDPDVSELGCVLVFFPNAPEYRQALFGQLAELSDVWNWEGTREQQALARVAWLAAELETINNMTCLDELLAEVQAINAKLPWCCEDGTGYSEGVGGGDGTVTIWPTPGPPPLPVPDTDFGTDDYPITPVTDPDDDGIVTVADWEQYLCGAANYLVDSLIDYLRFVRFQRSFTSSFLGVIRWLQARIAGAIIPGAADDFALWELNDLLDTVINAFENVPIAVIDDAIEDLEGLRQNIYCAIQGENVAQNAIDAALTIIFGSVDNALAQSLIGNPVALFASLIWNGALDVAWRDDCEECIDPPDLVVTEDFSDGLLTLPFTKVGDVVVSSGYAQLNSDPANTRIIISHDTLEDFWAGVDDGNVIRIRKIAFDHIRFQEAGTPNLFVAVQGSTIWSTSTGTVGVWESEDLDVSGVADITLSSGEMIVWDGINRRVDNLVVWFDLIS